VFLIKTDAAGDTQWTRTFGGAKDDYGLSARQTKDGGFVVGGWTMSNPDSSTRIWLIKTDANGDTLWTRTIDSSSGFAEGGPIEQLDDGGYVIAGFCINGAFTDVYLIRTDSFGDTLWTKTFGGPDLDMGISVQRTGDGGFVIVGETYSFGAGLSDFYLIKTDADGNVAVSEPKTSPPGKPIPSLVCAPNPFSGGTKIGLASWPSNSASPAVRIFDVQGRCVRQLTVDRESYAVWDGKDDLGRPLPSGPYFARCDTKRGYATARTILQR